MTAIGQYAFQSCFRLKSVHISSLTAWCQIKFDYNANPLRQAHELYLNGERVTKLVLPEGLKSVGTDAFAGCTGLTEVTIHDGVTAIGGSAFSGCSGLTGVTIPSHVTDIGDSAFSDCSGLTEMVIPHSVKAIGVGVFKKCNRLTKITVDPANAHYMSQNDLLLTRDGRTLVQGVNGAVMIPSGVTVIGESAFKDYDGLTQVTIPAGVEVIGPAAFYGCGGLTDVEIPAGVEAIGANAFYGCSGLADVVIPASVTSIGNYTFDGCSGLTNVIIGIGVTDIGGEAFRDCSSLTSVTIPDSVTSIGGDAFEKCNGLTNIFFVGNKPYVAYRAFNLVANECTVLVTKGSLGWGVEIPGTWNGMRIEYYAFLPLPYGAAKIEVAKALSDATDDNLAANIVDGTNYNAFCAWAQSVKDASGSASIGAQTVKESANAWLSYAFAADALIEKELTSDDVKIESFTPASTDGKFEFTVSVKDVNIGGGSVAVETLKENLKKVLGIEGAATLSPSGFSSDNIDITFDTPVDGKAKFTV